MQLKLQISLLIIASGFCQTPSIVPSSYCGKNCLWSSVGNGECNQECQIPECNFDQNDCTPGSTTSKLTNSTQCSEGCEWDWLGNGFCNTACLTQECMFDYNDCASSVTSNGTYACAVNCTSEKINNSECNPVKNALQDAIL